MKARLERLRNKLRWRGTRRSGTTAFWAIDQLVPRMIHTWPDESEALVGEIQLATDHFSLADTQAGIVYTTHAVAEEHADDSKCRCCR